MECVDNFTYLGSVQSLDGYCGPDIRRRIALAASVISSLRIRNIWKDRLSLSTKTRIYQKLVVSVLLYASETWTLLAADVKTLEAFHMKCQRQIPRIRWQDHVRNDEVAARTGLRPMMESIRRRREAIFGHMARMSPTFQLTKH